VIEKKMESGLSLEEAPKKLEKKFAKFFSLFENPENREKRVALFSHSCPDPDAIGSLLSLSWLLYRLYGIESDIFYDGKISHPQNRSMVNLLGVRLDPIESLCPDNYQMFMLCDTVPANAGTGLHNISFDVVFDHHREVPNGGFKGLFFNIKAGSCCGTMYSLIEESGLTFQDDNDSDSKVATALMVGIVTDTDHLMSDDTTEYEFKAWSDLFEFRDSSALKHIINYQRPKLWVDMKAEAVKQATVDDGVAVVGLGIIPWKQRDVIADMASEMVQWEDVKTAITFAIIDGERIEGSIRSSNPSVSVPDLCRQIAGKFGSGGGKFGAGAYKIDLEGLAFDPDDEENVRDNLVKAINQKEISRIFRLMRK